MSISLRALMARGQKLLFSALVLSSLVQPSAHAVGSCSLSVPLTSLGHYRQTGPVYGFYYDRFLGTGWLSTHGTEIRTWYHFRIPSLTRQVTRAEIRMNAQRVFVDTGGATFELHELRQNLTNLGVYLPTIDYEGIFEDLGDGQLWGTARITQDQGTVSFSYNEGAIVRIPLTSEAVASIQANAGKPWLVGGRLIDSTGPTPSSFAFGNPNLGWVNAQLVLSFESSDPPQIILPPIKPTALAGNRLTVPATVCGKEPIEFTWFKDGVTLSGQSTSTLDIPSLKLSDSGSYELRVRNELGTITSAPFRITVEPFHLSPLPERLQILSPQDQIPASPAPSLEPLVYSAEPLEFQWRRNGVALPNATGPRLFLHNTTSTIAAAYDVVIRNSSGSRTSTVTQVEVLAPFLSRPILSGSLGTQSPVIGFPTSLSVPMAAGSAPLLFSWFKDGVAIPGTGEQTLTIPAVAATDAGVYSVAVRNSLGSTTGIVARLQPVLVSFTRVFDGVQNRPLVLSVQSATNNSLQWRFEGEPIPGATNAELALGPATLAMTGNYSVTASTPSGDSGSVTQRVTVARFEFPIGPLGSANPAAGSDLILTARRDLGPVSSWQWFKNGGGLADQTNRNLFIQRVSTNDTAEYRLDASTPSGLLQSYPAHIEVLEEKPGTTPHLFIDPTALEAISGSIALLGNRPNYFPNDQTADMTFQWQRHGRDLPGETNRILSIVDVRAEDSGEYVLIARNGLAEGRFTNSLTVLPSIELDRWEWRWPEPQGSRLFSVAYGNGRFVATGRAGNVVTSINGVDWQAALLDETLNLSSARFEDGAFIAENLFSDRAWPARLVSTNGLNWEFEATGDAPSFAASAEQNGLRLGISAQQVWSSTNGMTWRRVAQAPEAYRAAAGNDLFVLAGPQSLYWSANGEHWHGTDIFSLNGWRDLTFGAGKFVASGSDLHNFPALYVSSDGSHWQDFSLPEGLEEFLYSDPNVIIAKHSENGRLLISTNGTSWEKIDTGGRQEISSLTFGGGRYVAVGGAGMTLSSTNARSWTGVNPAHSIDLFGVTQGKDGLTVAIGEFGTIMTSLDGETWTQRTSPTTRYIHDVHYADGLFIGVGRRGTILTSSDGISWETRNSGADVELNRIFRANGLWIIAADGGLILTSADGSNWTKHSTDYLWGALTEHEGIAYGNGRWVVVGGFNVAGAVPTIVTSDDGVNWAPAWVDTGKRLRDVAFGGGWFVAVGNDGVVAVSRDARNWVYRFIDGSNFRRVVYENGRFVAMGNDGTLFSSTNPGAREWRSHLIPTSQNLHDLALRPDGSFIAVGNNGMIMQSDRPASRVTRVRIEGSQIILEHNASGALVVEGSSDLRTWREIPAAIGSDIRIAAIQGGAQFFRFKTP